MDSESATLNAAQRSVGDRTARLATAPIVLDAEGITKTFRIPDQRIESFKERAVHPLWAPALPQARCPARRLASMSTGRVLRDRRPQRLREEHPAQDPRQHLHGRSRAGSASPARLAPFIELGVGFDPDLSARDNVILNGVMMGLTPSEAERRIDAVFDFAELSDFKDLQLEELLIRDDRAARFLGDDPGRRRHHPRSTRCSRSATQRSSRSAQTSSTGCATRGKTVVLVTHDMGAVETLLRPGDAPPRR